jgi:hypothetical protein
MSARLPPVSSRLLFTLALALFMFVAGTASAQELTPGGTFIDDDGSVHEGAIEAIHARGITSGCPPPMSFCPRARVTRAQMATFLARAFKLPPATGDYFPDDGGSVHEGAINSIAEAGIATGYPDGSFRPNAFVPRQHMATFLVRAMGLEPIEADVFVDVEGIHEPNVNALADSSITRGCSDDGSRFCPHALVERGQMASFLARALGLPTPAPPPRPPVHLVSRFTTYHDCCETRVHNIQVMARAMNGANVLPGAVFDLNAYLGPRTEAKGYKPAPILLNGEGYCCDHPLNIGGGTSQFGTTFYNAIFWGAYDEIEHRPHTRYIARYPLGIEATLGYPSPNVVFRNDTYTTLTIRTSYTSTSITVELWGNNGGRTVVGGHRSGRTTMDVRSAGDGTARRVTARVVGTATYADGGQVTVYRTITGPAGATTESWTHRYLGASS